MLNTPYDGDALGEIFYTVFKDVNLVVYCLMGGKPDVLSKLFTNGNGRKPILYVLWV